MKMTWSERLRTAARPLKPRRKDALLVAGWFGVLFVAAAVWGFRLATGEGWFSKGLSTVLGDSVPLDVIKDRDRPFGFDEVVPGFLAMCMLVLAPLFLALGVGDGQRIWNRAAWVCIAITIPFVTIDALNIAGPSISDVLPAGGVVAGVIGAVCTAAFWLVVVVAGCRVLYDAWQLPSRQAQ